MKQQKQFTYHKIQQLEQYFKQICISLGEPFTYCNLFLIYLNKEEYTTYQDQLNIKSNIINAEVKLIKNKQSFTQEMSQLVRNREEIIRQLRSELIIGRNKKEINLKSACQKLEVIRLYTLTIIENICNLMKKFKVQQSQYTSDIITKVVQGIDFLRFTSLRKYIQFSNSEDPLFLVPLKKCKKTQDINNYILSLFTVDHIFHKRLLAADNFLKSACEENNSQSLELKPKKIIEEEQSASSKVINKSSKERKNQQPDQTQHKFLFPSILSKKNKESLSEANYHSSLLQRSVDNNDKLQDNRNIFKSLNSKKRSNTQINQYNQLKQQNNISNRVGKPMKTIECVQYGGGKDKLINQISKLDSNKRYKISVIEADSSSEHKLYKAQKTISRQKDQKFIENNFRFGQRQLSDRYRKFYAFSNQREQEQKQEQQFKQQVKGRVKRMRKKKGNRKIEQDMHRETVYKEEKSDEKQQIAEQFKQSDSKWYKKYGCNSKRQFSLEVQQKIFRLQMITGVQQRKIQTIPLPSNQEQTKQTPTSIKMSTDRDIQQGAKYINPFDQLSNIRNYKKTLEEQLGIQNNQLNTKSIKNRKGKINLIQQTNNDKEQMRLDQQLNFIKLQKIRGSIQSNHSSYIKNNVIQQSNKETKEIQNPKIEATQSHPNNKLQSKGSLSNSPNNISSKINNSPNIKTNKFTSKLRTNAVVRELSFQQVKNVSKDQNLAITFSKQQINEFSSSKQYGNPSHRDIANIQMHNNADENKRRQQRSSSILQKCIFQSKSMQQSQLLQQIKQFNRSSFRHLQPYLTTNYFKNRHILLTNCIYNQEIACYCIYYPYLINKSRYIFILHFQVREKYQLIQISFVNTFIKYIFCNDPTNKIILLKHKQLFHQELTSTLSSQGNYVGEIKTPIKASQLAQKSYLFQRKQLKCNKELELSTIINSRFLLIASQDFTLRTPKQKNFYFSSYLMKKLQNTLKKRQTKIFLNYNQLSSYLEQQKLPQFKTYNPNNEILFYSEYIQDCLIETRYFVYSKYFYFTIESPYTFLYQNQDVYYILLSTSVEKQYFILADKIFQQTENVDIYTNFRENVLNKKFNDIFGNEKRRGVMVACPQFNKQAEISFGSNSSGIINLSLNWKEYIKGVRYFSEEKIEIELIAPFFCGLVDLDEDSQIRQIYSAMITEDDIVK